MTNLINSNHNYCIYLTDYTRLLTYENNHLDCPLKAGSYLLSGYIDFLVSENAYFYYSPHYNRIKVCAGNYFNDVVTDRGKRFFFTLVFSDDSDSTYFTIQEDNGSLWALSDTTGGWNDGNSTSDKLEDITNSYFIGSNQTIYYAKEDNNHILDSLTNSIYYVGCSNSAYYRKYSASNPIKTRGNDDYIYNFDFSGGKIKYFFLSEYNSGSNISNENKDIADKKEKNTVITDTSNGNSNIIPTDHTTYTYIYNYITNESNPEEDEKHVETERNPYISDDKNEDTSNWSILDFLRGIYNTLTGKEDDSSPSTTSINQTTNIIKDKFSFKDNMINNANEIKNFIANTQETHKYYLNINHKYLQGNICIIDLSWYAPYKETVDAFICAFAYLAFIWHMFCRIPNLINGASATTYVSDISQYLNKK